MDSLNTQLGGSSALNFNSIATDAVSMPPNIEHLPDLSARAAFTVNFSSVFKEDIDIVLTIIDDRLSYIPWGGDNQMPFAILSLIDRAPVERWNKSLQLAVQFHIAGGKAVSVFRQFSALRLLPGYHIAVARVKYRCCRTRLRFVLLPEQFQETFAYRFLRTLPCDNRHLTGNFRIDGILLVKHLQDISI